MTCGDIASRPSRMERSQSNNDGVNSSDARTFPETQWIPLWLFSDQSPEHLLAVRLTSLFVRRHFLPASRSSRWIEMVSELRMHGTENPSGSRTVKA